MSEQQSTQPSGIEMNGFNDPTGLYLRKIGIGLIFAFFFPIIFATSRYTQLVFFNIEGIFEKGVPIQIIIQLIYPLIAGIFILLIARGERSANKAMNILMTGLLPFLLLLLNENIRRSLWDLISELPGGGTLTITALLGHLGVFGILAGVHATRVNSRLIFPTLVAVLGAGLYLLAILIPINGEFSFINVFKTIFAHDNSKVGLMFVSGFLSLAIMGLMVLISVKCFNMLKKEADRGKMARGILKLFVILFIVICMYLVYLLVVLAIKQHGGPGLLGYLTLLIKLVPWILGLYLLIPLGISEFLLLGKAAEPKLT